MRLFLVIALALLASSQAQQQDINVTAINVTAISLNALDCWEPGADCNSSSCTEAESDRCVDIALCDKSVIPVAGCHCPEGLIGTGCVRGVGLDCGTYGCSTEGWTARAMFDVTGKQINGNDITADYNNKIVGITNGDKRGWSTGLFGQAGSDYWSFSSIHHTLSEVAVWDEATNAKVDKVYLTINILFRVGNRDLADAAVDVFNTKKNNAASNPAVNGNYDAQIGKYVFNAPLVFGANVYRWKAETTRAPISVQTTGMTVDSVHFSPACKDSGCWVFDVTYTAGSATGNFNTFYLPRVQDDDGKNWQEDESYDRVHTGIVAKSFFPDEFPCGSNVKKGASSQWVYSMAAIQTTGVKPTDGFTTTCCIPNFLDNYRAVQGFEDYFNTTFPACQGGEADVIDRPRYTEKSPWDNVTLVPFPAAQPFLAGNFSDINAHAEYLSPLDPFIGQHRARIFIDEVELRRKAGKLTGTVGVEYTVDTFLGFANFRPAGTYVLDSAAMQVNLHLEKTNFFSVSTEGTNAYTFLEYVNMRLVTIYDEDVEFGGETEDGADPDKKFGTNFYRTSSAGSADYVQVTFTMGEQYSPNLLGDAWDSGLIPLNSVRAGKGTFFSDDFMKHKCVDYFKDPAAFDGDANARPTTAPPSNTVASGSNRRSDGAGATSDPDSRRSGVKSRREDDPYALKPGTDNPYTWGPLDSCFEQTKCTHIEWREIKDEPMCKGDGDCTWEACLVFDDAIDPGCRVYQECPQFLCREKGEKGTEAYCPYVLCDGKNLDHAENMRYINGLAEDNPLIDILIPLYKEEDMLPKDFVWGQHYSGEYAGQNYEFSCESTGIENGLAMSKCDFSISEEQRGPGDFTKDYFQGNLYMWCEHTTEDCPADHNYPHKDIEYFDQNMGATFNITRNERTCQRGKPGQKLFFVMRDGSDCAKVPSAGFYEIPDATKALWKTAGHPWPEDYLDARATCEPRDDPLDECLGCGFTLEKENPMNADGTPWDGKNPCGCEIEGENTDSSFDTCTTPFDESVGGVKNNQAECVWTITLPAKCTPTCACGLDEKKDGSCKECTDAGGPAECTRPIEDPHNPSVMEDAGFKCCGTFNERLCQDCASKANMCISPLATPDHFVSFNIPLGIDWFPLDWGENPETLDDNVFVHMVINARDSTGCDDPNTGCAPLQAKTTLFGSIPVVQGGINIFCDGVRAKTDLKDVADADIVVGTATSMAELSRLRILENVATTSLNKLADDPARVIDSDSIEAGFLTLVVKGNSSYFNLPGTKRYALELEDLITVHIMEPASVAFDAVQALLETAGDDNYDTGVTDNPELLLTGYKLNGAFRFSIDRDENRASLEPTDALLARCPFNPPRPTLSDPFPTTCVTRRDVRHRGFPNRNGALSTAMEVVPLWNVAEGTCATDDQDGRDAQRTEDDGVFAKTLPACNSGCTLAQNAEFMQTVLGASNYAETLGRNYSCVIAQKYKLDSRYNRAWWINPNYEWTPTQTGGQPIFTISQKIFLFALINLNEQWGAPSTAANLALPSTLTRRRLLSSTANTGTGVGASLVQFDVSPTKMMASAFGVPEDKVATWKVVLALSEDQACMDPALLQSQIRALMKTYALDAASKWDELVLTSMSVDKDGVQCPATGRRTIARRLLNNPSVTVEMMIVFAKGGNALFDMDKFSKMDGIMSMEPVDVSPKVTNTDQIADEDKRTSLEDEDDDSSSNNIGIIAGCAGGAGFLLLLGGGFMLWRMNRQTAEAEVASALPDLAALKSQLQSESA